MTKTPKDTDMENQKNIYVTFVSTPYKMGKLITFVTGYEYNHSALCLDEGFPYFVSFSRRYKSAPFCGGLTKESPLRLEYKGRTAKIKICAVPVSKEQHENAKKHIEKMFSQYDDYIYNMFGAAVLPFGKHIKIEKSFICVEFVLSMLKKYADIPVLKDVSHCNIKELSAMLEPYKIYEGPAEKFIKGAGWNGDTFPEKKGMGFYFKKTFSNNAELFRRFLKQSSSRGE